MNFLNRLLVILLILLTVAAVTLCAAIPAAVLAIVANGAAQLSSLADRLLPNGRLLAAGVGLGVNLVLLFWLWLEIRRSRRRTVQVRQTDGARAEVTTDTLKEQLEFAVDGLAGVVSARAKVRSHGRSVEVAIEAEITPDTPVSDTAGQIGATVRDVVESAMGLKLRGKPRIKIKSVRLPELPPDLPAADSRESQALAVAPSPEP